MLKRHTQVVLLLTIVAVLITLALLLLDFRLQQGQMAVDSNSERLFRSQEL